MTARRRRTPPRSAKAVQPPKGAKNWGPQPRPLVRRSKRAARKARAYAGPGYRLTNRDLLDVAFQDLRPRLTQGLERWYFRHYGGPECSADDVLQETFLQVRKTTENLRLRVPANVWLHLYLAACNSLRSLRGLNKRDKANHRAAHGVLSARVATPGRKAKPRLGAIRKWFTNVAHSKAKDALKARAREMDALSRAAQHWRVSGKYAEVYLGSPAFAAEADECDESPPDLCAHGPDRKIIAHPSPEAEILEAEEQSMETDNAFGQVVVAQVGVPHTVPSARAGGYKSLHPGCPTLTCRARPAHLLSAGIGLEICYKDICPGSVTLTCPERPDELLRPAVAAARAAIRQEAPPPPPPGPGPKLANVFMYSAIHLIGNMCLSGAELAEVTGKSRPSAQARTLNHLGITHKRRPDGTVLVHRDHFDRVLGADSSARAESRPEQLEPNWDALTPRKAKKRTTDAPKA